MKLLEKVIHCISARNTEDIEKNVCIYCRVSTASKEQLSSLGSQISTLTRRVSHVKQWRLVDVFIDEASAKHTSNRQEFERMLQACAEDQISIIESLSQAENESRSDNIRRGLTMRAA